MNDFMAERARVVRLLATCSAVALLTTVQAAHAACTPNPTQSGVTTACTGSEPAGLVVGGSGATVSVTTGATVTAPAGVDAISIVPGAAAATYGLYATIEVDGRVDGGTASGISLTSGVLRPGGYLFAGSSAAITVASGGNVGGAVGLAVAANPGSPYGTAIVSIDNNGAITGSQLALGGSTSTLAYFSTVTNEAGGTIGTINAAIGSLVNRGAITGDVTVVGPGSYGQGPTVDTGGGGTIAGNLTLGDNSRLGRPGSRRTPPSSSV